MEMKDIENERMTHYYLLLRNYDVLEDLWKWSKLSLQTASRRGPKGYYHANLSSQHLGMNGKIMLE